MATGLRPPAGPPRAVRWPIDRLTGGPRRPREPPTQWFATPAGASFESRPAATVTSRGVLDVERGCAQQPSIRPASSRAEFPLCRCQNWGGLCGAPAVSPSLSVPLINRRRDLEIWSDRCSSVMLTQDRAMAARSRSPLCSGPCMTPSGSGLVSSLRPATPTAFLSPGRSPGIWPSPCERPSRPRRSRVSSSPWVIAHTIAECSGAVTALSAR